MKEKPIDVNAVLDRVKEALNLKNDVELAEALGTIPSVVSNWRNRNAMKFENLMFVCEQRGINLRWVIFGKGDKFVCELPEGVRYFKFVKLVVEEKEELVDDVKQPFRSSDSHGGFPMVSLVYLAPTKKKKTFCKIVVDESRHLGINISDKDYPENCLIYEVDEDGMTPVIRSGDFVIFECFKDDIFEESEDTTIDYTKHSVTKEEHTFTGQLQTAQRDIYLIRHKEMNRLFLRRSIAQSSGTIDFVPDNHQYPSFKSSQVEVIGRVIEVIKRVRM